ncbi:AraC family transcriptional regulator [Gaoshiqia sp. Z1-71]|uniref:AraC family transcriptional regulator n=1 Tax=Gaoshiqia hydrogeniformans TaxID=3290090 RepID=UPI003BF84837
MTPLFQKIEANLNHSFHVDHMKFHYFPNPLQFHPEIEILLILQGTGTRIVGDSISRFRPGDVILVGPNIPHVSYSDSQYTSENSKLFSEVIFVLFKAEIFGEQFWSLPESKSILKLLQISRGGIILHGKTREEVSSLMLAMRNSSGFNRITILLSILGVIATRKEYQLLANPITQNNFNESDSDRLDKVYDYVCANYYQEITLEKVASLACLSIPAFCSYFKKRTNKTFVQALNEIRIAQACRMLTEENQPVSGICYSCGYTNVSYFIKQFKKITGFTPLKYKNKYEN